MKKNNREYLLIIDGSSLLATSYYATLPRAARKEKDEEKKERMLEKMLPKNKDGRYINGVRQFFHTLCTILVYQKPTHLAICWDCGKETFRKVLFPPYKSNRRITPQTLRQQYETAYEICSRLRIRQFRSKEYEADDFAGSIAAAMEPYMPVRILTRDKDFFQLITERTAIWYGMADKTAVKEWRRKYSMVQGLPSKVAEIDRHVLWEQFGWTPESITMLKSLSGDVSDNIPGVYGMGELRSLKLALHYHHPDELYADIDAASTPKGRKDLAALWRSWGIRKNPYPCLTSRGSKNRQPARSMAYLCYTLGKIRTDLVAKDSHEMNLPSDFRIVFSHEQTVRILGQFGILIQLRKNGSKKEKSKPAASRQPKAAGQNNTEKTGQKASGQRKQKGRTRPVQPQKKAKSQSASHLAARGNNLPQQLQQVKNAAAQQKKGQQTSRKQGQRAAGSSLQKQPSSVTAGYTSKKPNGQKSPKDPNVRRKNGRLSSDGKSVQKRSGSCHQSNRAVAAAASPVLASSPVSL